MQTRNQLVDIIRGFAMLLVVLGHTISGSTTEYQGTLLFQMIWTLQMPLFIIISGYVTKYSKPIDSLQGLGAVLGKRTLAYLLPWTVWMFVVRGLIFQQTKFFDIKYLLWHMDTGYWFLITIWTINVIYLCADYCSNKLTDNPIYSIGLHLLFCVIGMALLASVGYLAGFSFCCIKLTLYYIPFYLLGYLYGHIQEKVQERKKYNTFVDVTVCLTLALWLALIVRYDFFTNSSGLMIALRFAASTLGCISVIGLLSSIYARGGEYTRMVRSPFSGNLSDSLSVPQPDYDSSQKSQLTRRSSVDDSKLCTDHSAGSSGNQVNSTQQSAQLPVVFTANSIKQFFAWSGVHSLEIYLIHGFSLCLLKLGSPLALSAKGIVLAVINYAIALTLSCVYIKILKTNSVIRKVLFWK